MDAVEIAPFQFVEFPKIARLSRACVVTEKIDGTNGVIHIGDAGEFLIGSRSQWITPERDNHGFARWAMEHKEELMQLGSGTHYGEWWGSGIQRGYGLQKGEKRFSLFNVARWADDRDREKFPVDRPACCHVVPVIKRCEFDTSDIEQALSFLKSDGSLAVPGFMKPEGIVIFHEAARLMFKKTIDKDAEWKGKQGA